MFKPLNYNPSFDTDNDDDYDTPASTPVGLRPSERAVLRRIVPSGAIDGRAQQVEALLEDLAGIPVVLLRQSSPDTYYLTFSRSFVRRRTEDEWELVDGQQRTEPRSADACAPSLSLPRY